MGLSDALLEISLEGGPPPSRRHGPHADPLSHLPVVAYKYGALIPAGVLLADKTALREIDEALQIAERSGNDHALATPG